MVMVVYEGRQMSGQRGTSEELGGGFCTFISEESQRAFPACLSPLMSTSASAGHHDILSKPNKHPASGVPVFFLLTLAGMNIVM